MKRLHISTDFSLPIEAVTQTIAVLAKRGAGKTYAASVMAEEMLSAGQQIAVLDPTGAWRGLRSNAAGTGPGFPIIVAGGDHGDIPLEEHAGEVLARAMVERRFSAILDLSLFRKGQVRRFVTPFLETLYRMNREPLHLFVDEADDICPQRPFGDEAQMVGAMEDVVKRGRRKGIGCTLITQRPADLAKQVLTQCEMLVALRLVHPRDIGAVREWINVHADPDKAAEMIASLPSLPVGTAWFWSPGWGDIFQRAKIRQRQTFDSSATPKPGDKPRQPTALAAVDVQALGAEIAATVQKAKENDPAELRRQIAELKRQVQAKPATAPADPAAIERAVQKAVRDRDLHWQAIVRELKEMASGIGASLRKTADHAEAVYLAAEARLESKAAGKPRENIPDGIPASRCPVRSIPDRPAKPMSSGSIGGGLRRMLIALAQRPQGMSARQLGVRAGLSSTSGTFGTYLGTARSNGWIDGGRDLMRITDAGLGSLGHYEPLPSGQALLDYWLRELGDSGAARMLQALAEAYPKAMTKDELGVAAGLSANSGTFGTYLGKLRTLELVQGRSELRASEELFEG